MGWTSGIPTQNADRKKVQNAFNSTDISLAGFPKRDESVYDPFGAGHSSTSISAGLGTLRRLHSMSALATTSSLQPAHSSLQNGEYGVTPTSTEEQKTYTKFLKDLESENDKQASTKEAILKLYRQRTPFSWFPNITLRFGNNKVILSNGKILLGCFFVLMCYFMQRKQASLKRIVKNQAAWIQKGVADL